MFFNINLSIGTDFREFWIGLPKISMHWTVSSKLGSLIFPIIPWNVEPINNSKQNNIYCKSTSTSGLVFVQCYVQSFQNLLRYLLPINDTTENRLSYKYVKITWKIFSLLNSNMYNVYVNVYLVGNKGLNNLEVNQVPWNVMEGNGTTRVIVTGHLIVP